MGILTFSHFPIILFIILNGFGKQMSTDVLANDAKEVDTREAICLSAYDVITFLANFNHLFVDVENIEKNVANNITMSNSEKNFHPIFDVVKDDGCLKLILNPNYAKIFGEPVRKFLKDLLDGIVPLVKRDEKTNNCPNGNDAIMLMAINLCAVGISFSDQLSKTQIVADNILQNAMEQFKRLKPELNSKYEKLHKKLIDNGYEKQLKNSVILNDITSGGYKIKFCENKLSTRPVKTTTEICVPPFDVLLLTANFNQLTISVDVKILEKNNPMSNIEVKFHPIFDVIKVGGCFKLKLNTAYANILGEPAQKFLKEMIDGINNHLLHCDENNVPDENNAIMLMAINFCVVGRSFSDQLSKAQNLTDKMLQNSMKQLDSVNSKLSAKYEKLHKKLTDNGYEKQLKNAVILKVIASHGYKIKLCKLPPKPRDPVGGAVTPRPELYNEIVEREKNLTWEKYVRHYGRYFKSLEDVAYSANNFKMSKQEIDAHNAIHAQGGRTSYYMRYTKFSDQKTFPSGKKKGYPKTSLGIASRDERTAKGGTLDDSIDWRKTGAITPVSDQTKECGSCYTFSAVACLEFLHFRKTKKLETFSKQQYIDCARGVEYTNFGCNGGFPEAVFDYVLKHGAMLESDYPYTASEGERCEYNESNTALRIKEWRFASCDFNVSCQQNDEESMKMAVAMRGPLSVAVYTGCSTFKNYGGGVYDDKCCLGISYTDHAMTIVGYGKDYWGTPHWILKNSWGTEWGENGYMRLKRGVNQCGVATEALYPVL